MTEVLAVIGIFLMDVILLLLDIFGYNELFQVDPIPTKESKTVEFLDDLAYIGLWIMGFLLKVLAALFGAFLFTL